MSWLKPFVEGFIKLLKSPEVKKAAKKIADTVIVAVVVEGGKQVVSYIATLPEKVSDWWNGKKIGIIGPTAAGKNSFFQKLKGEAAPKEHIQTRGAENISSFDFNRTLPSGKPFTLHCKRSINVGGEVDQRDRFWEQAIEDSEVVFYIVDMGIILEGDFRPHGRVHDDLRWLVGHLGKAHSPALVHILLNKYDLYPNYFPGGTSHKKLEGVISEFELVAKDIFDPFSGLLTGISVISMTEPDLFEKGLAIALESVYKSVHKGKR